MNKLKKELKNSVTRLKDVRDTSSTMSTVTPWLLWRNLNLGNAECQMLFLNFSISSWHIKWLFQIFDQNGAKLAPFGGADTYNLYEGIASSQTENRIILREHTYASFFHMRTLWNKVEMILHTNTALNWKEKTYAWMAKCPYVYETKLIPYQYLRPSLPRAVTSCLSHDTK